jgi:GNAT superfamily N-acetyltransferase
MALTIRPARSDEAPLVVPLYDWLFAPPGGMAPSWDPVVAVDRVQALIDGSNSEVLLALDGEQVAGFGTIAVDLLSVRFGARAWVEDLAVDPSQRSLGVGKALLDGLRSWAADHGATHLELDSGDSRVDAHRFYDREQPTWTSRCFAWWL